MSAGDDLAPGPAWLSRLPGYAGYAAKEARRQADRAVREELARRLTAAVQSLQRVSAALAAERLFSELAAVDRASSRIQHLVDRLRSVSEGYRGLFDQERVDEAVLNQIVAFDRAMGRGVETIVERAATLNAHPATPVMTSPAGVELTSAVERLHAQLDARGNLFSSGAALPAEAALAVLADSAPATNHLVMKRGDAVAIDATDYVVDAVIAYAGDRPWVEYRLRDGTTERWLSVAAGLVLMLTLVTAEEVTIEETGAARVAGHQFHPQAQGTATAALNGPGGERRGVPVTYASYLAADDHWLVVRDWDGERLQATGEPVDPAQITVYPRS
jgi:hypothetical protein